MSEHTIIVGGGLAGLAAATALAARNVRVTLLESRPRLGGRAGSFQDAATGTQIDNCQHVSMGCCTNFDHFCSTLGLGKLFRMERELFFIGPDGKTNRFSAGMLPAPLHLFPALRRLSYLDADRRSLARGLKALARLDDATADDETFDHWLARHNQTPTAIERFWHVVLVSALSESLDRINVSHARKVFVDAFLANRNGWQVRIPTVPLDELYGRDMTDWLTSRGASIRLQSGVRRILIEDGRATRVELRDREQLAADQFVVAVPHDRVLPLLPDALARDPQLDRIEHIQTAPISSVHLWFDRPFTDLPHAVFVSRLSQWMFNRTALQSSNRNTAVTNGREGKAPAEPLGDSGAGKSTHYYQIVISNSRELEGRTTQHIVAEVLSELAAVWPLVSDATLIHSRVVTEHKAVFSVRPGIEALRPDQQTSIANLQLAGDWTNTGWPGTMESAVRSGYLAAENVLANLGRPERLLQPDLPVARLSKLLLGL